MKLAQYLIAIVFLLNAFTACSDSSDSENEYQESSYQDGDYDDGYDPTYVDPFQEYCFSGPDADLSKLTVSGPGDDCILRTEGRTKSDMNDLKINAVFTTLFDFEPLKQVGIKNFSYTVTTGYDSPKYAIGTYVLKPYSILSFEKGLLPDIMASVSDLDSSSVFDSVSTLDKERLLKSGASSLEHMPPFEIASASMTITHVEDIPLDEDELETQKFRADMGRLTGKQYVKGTISFTVKKFGSKGADFGPATFSFASVNNWVYFPNLGN